MAFCATGSGVLFLTLMLDPVSSGCGGTAPLADGDRSRMDLGPGSDAAVVDLAPRQEGPSIRGLHVSGSAILNGAGQSITLRGVNRSGTEYACVQGRGPFDGPSDAASVQAIKGWRCNAVRVPLNESCWLGINGAPPALSGASYRQAIEGYVHLLVENDLVPILELHWSAPGEDLATGQQPMPDADHSVELWRQVAATFKDESAVIFEPFNEPYPDENKDSAQAWRCWRDGGTCAGVPYRAAGMQELVGAIRGAGAGNVILLGGVQYANALSGWLAHRPTDPAGNLGAAWHVYPQTPCHDDGCWHTSAAALLGQVPLLVTELGEDDCTGRFISPLMAFLDQNGAGYLAWTWDAWSSCYALISDYSGTPAGAYGRAFKDHLSSVQP
jgi:endoglucanase